MHETTQKKKIKDNEVSQPLAIKLQLENLDFSDDPKIIAEIVRNLGMIFYLSTAHKFDFTVVISPEDRQSLQEAYDILKQKLAAKPELKPLLQQEANKAAVKYWIDQQAYRFARHVMNNDPFFKTQNSADAQVTLVNSIEQFADDLLVLGIHMDQPVNTMLHMKAANIAAYDKKVIEDQEKKEKRKADELQPKQMVFIDESPSIKRTRNSKKD